MKLTVCGPYFAVCEFLYDVYSNSNFLDRGERKYVGTKVPGSESSREREFHLWNFRSRERKYVETKVSLTKTEMNTSWYMAKRCLLHWYFTR